MNRLNISLSQILAKIVQERLEIARDIHQDSESPLNYTALATMTEGYSATDLQDLVARAVHQVAIRSSKNTAQEDSSVRALLSVTTNRVLKNPFNLVDLNFRRFRRRTSRFCPAFPA